MKWVVVGLALLALVVDFVTAVTGGTLTFLAGMGLVYVGERLFGDDPLRWVMTGAGLAVVAVSVLWRARLLSGATGTRRDAHRRALVWTAVSASSLVLYALSTDPVVAALGLTEEGAERWQVVFAALVPIAFIVGVLPAFLLDRALAVHPIVLPAGAARRAITAGLGAALGLSLVFPVNFLASQHKWEWDYAYFKVADPGTATVALVKSLAEPVTVTLFYPSGSEVAREMRPYFDQLEAASEGRLVVEQVDQALAPELAEKLKIRENGTIAFQQGDATEKLAIKDDIDKARRDLKKLDENVQKYLLKVARGQRVAYVTVGHGEASSKEKDDPLQKLNAFKSLLESQNYKVKNLGMNEGLTDAVPDDAAIVIVAAPDKPFLPEEEKALSDYLDKGGKLLVLVEPNQEPLDGVLGKLGLKARQAPLANAKYFVRQTRGPADRVLLYSNRFGSHEAVSTLSKNSTQLAVLMPTVVALDEVKGGPGKTSVLIRTPPDTWEDVDGDREQGSDEKGDVHNVAFASTGPDAQPWRAIVVGDVSVFSDVTLQYSVGNQQFTLDAVRWLVGDESLAGTTESEEDVKIQHTKDENVAWFYGTIFAVPMLVLATGVLLTTTRKRGRKA